MGKPELNGKMNTLQNQSQNNSLLLQRADSNQSIGKSGFGGGSPKNALVDNKRGSFRAGQGSNFYK